MLKKIAVAALISSFAIASFAATETKADTKATVAPAATEQKAETPKPAKHVKHHHGQKAVAKTETPAAK
ncbi:MAG: hypothetical protein PHQ05_14630 [Sterolibacterium sp.]|nr:hypothetical protein [Sterolibacterium sp.]